MASEFKLPTLGENTKQGTVGKVLIAKGDTLEENQPVVEIETDKAVAEIPSDVTGTVVDIKVKEGQTVQVGQVLFTYKAGGGAKASKAEEAPKESPKQEAVSAPARREAPKLHVLDKPAAASAAKSATRPAAASSAPRTGHVAASPSVRRLARELGVDLNSVETSDPAGRVSVEDVQRAAQGGGRKATQKGEPAGISTAAPVEAPAEPYHEMQTDTYGPVATEPMNNIRKKTVEFMTHCWTTIPHVTHFEKADITELEVLRKKYGRKVEAAGGKLTITSFLLKIATEALKRFPKFNSSLDLENEQILLK